MTVTYQVERWSEAVDELRQHFEAHWREVALHQDTIPLEPHYERLAELDGQDALHLVTVRDGRRLVGYIMFIVGPHLHYRNTLHAQADIYWLHPDYRKGTTGIRLFKEAERSLRGRGVKKIIAGTKVHRDVGPIFEFLGWTETERLFTKYIG